MPVSLLKQPSALVPLAMAVAALALVLVHYAMFGVTHDTDEGTPAHLFQLLIVLQVPCIAYFALKWLPVQARRASGVLSLWAAIVVAAFACVVWFT